MKLGVVFPQTEISADPGAVRAYAETADALGYDYLLAYDHVLGANPHRPGGWAGRPYDYQDMFHEIFVLFGYLAGITERLQLVSGIVIAPQRQTALLAKQAAAIDVLSGGRLILGLGIGWNEVEYEALGMNFHDRGRRVEEQVELMRALWTERLVDFQGQYHRIPDAGLHPLPLQRPIPIWFGGGAERALRRMARIGDGWLATGMDLADLRDKLARLRGFLSEAGREEAEFGVEMRFNLGAVARGAWAERVTTLRAMGATMVSCDTMNMGLVHPDEHIATIRAFYEEVSAGADG